MQHALSESHWYVSGYSLGFENPMNMQFEDLFTDVKSDETMFRIVVKSNLTRGLALDLTNKMAEVIEVLDSMDSGYESLRSKVHYLSAKEEDVPILASTPEDVATSTAHTESVKSSGDRRLESMRRTSLFANSFRKTNKNKIVTQHIC